MNRILQIIRPIMYVATLTFSLPLIVCGQQQERLVDWHPTIAKSETKVLELVDTKVAGVSIAIGQVFRADDGWLNTLTFTVRNISGKTIKILGFGIGFPEIGSNEGMPGFSITYKGEESMKDSPKAKKYLLPGEEVSLTLPEDQLEIMRRISMRERGTPNLTKVSILPGLVHFEDGSAIGGVSVRKQTRE